MESHRSFEPVFRENVFTRSDADAIITEDRMTLGGVVKKTTLSLCLVLGTAAFAWKTSNTEAANIQGRLILFSILALVFYFIAIFKTEIAHIMTPLYALTEGFLLGYISWFAERMFPGIALSAFLATIGVIGAMLIIYKTGIIRPSQKLAIVLSAAMLGILLVYFADFVMALVGSGGISIVRGNSNVAILFSAFICVVAALQLLYDFEFISQQTKAGAPKNFEWVAALGLLVSIIWIYVEVLRLLMKLYSRRDD